MCGCCNAIKCECEEIERSEVCRTINRLVENMMWKICEKEKTEAETLMLKLFKFFGTAKDLSSIGEALIQYEAALKVQELRSDIKEDKAETEEGDMSSLFDVKED